MPKKYAVNGKAMQAAKNAKGKKPMAKKASPKQGANIKRKIVAKRIANKAKKK